MIRALRAAPLGALLFVTATGCLFPEYTFEETGGGGQGGSTTGGGGQGGAGGSGGATTGGGGQGGMVLPPTEDCFAAGDEDDNGMADCADPACDADLECVDAIPVGWGNFGHVALFEGSASADPACPPGTSTEVYTGNADLMQPAASCTSCSCGTPSWQACAFNQDYDAGQAGLQPFQVRDVACAVGTASNLDELTVPVPWNLMCTATDTAPGGGACPGASCNQSIKVGTARPSNGTCGATGGQPVAVMPTWGTGLKACQTAAGLAGCSGGQVCAPRPPSPFEARTCVAKAGDQACPAGAFSEKHLAYGDVDDNRACTACSCNAATGGSCTLAVSIYADNTCSTAAIATIDADATEACVDLPSNVTIAGRSATVKTAPTGGSCTAVAGGGQASGAFEPASPTTFCCLPPI